MVKYNMSHSINNMIDIQNEILNRDFNVIL
jgi:hypothetical protein